LDHVTQVGSTANSYEILSKLAEGGMAEIFLARSASGAGIRRHVVLKRVARERAADTEYVRMFLDEAKLAAQLQHPNIAQVFDIGQLGESYFFTMEYVHGVTVQALVERAHGLGLRLPIGAVLAIIAGAAAGLGHAHQRVGLDGRPLGIVHRDVSPSNLMISFEGHLKVVDFGVAKAVGRPETQAGEIKGKVGYLSPEQCRQLKLDARSDLFSLGIVAWEMLTGRRLFDHESAFATMAAIATEQAPPPSSLRTDLPPAIDTLVDRLLALEPLHRFQTAGEVIEAVEATAIQTTSAVSAATLSRLLRDLFGVVPEPWHALDREAVTVAVAPLPADLAKLAGRSPETDPALADVEQRLTFQFSSITPLPQFEADLDLSSTTNLVLAAHSRETRVVPNLAAEAARLLGEDDTTERERSTRPLTTRKPEAETLLARPLETPPSRPPEAAARPPDVAAPPPTARPTTTSSPPPFASVPPTVVSSVAPLTILGSGPYVPPAPAAIPGSGPRGLIAGTGPRPMLPHVAPPRPGIPAAGQPALRWWIIGGFLLGVVLTMIIVLATRSNKSADSSGPRDASVIAIDAIAVAVDAPQAIDASPADAAEEIDAVPVDAPEADDVAELAAMENEPKPPVAPRRRLRTKAELNAAFRARRFKDIVTACKELGADDDRAVVCTMAACWIKNPIAQEWFRNIGPQQRGGTIKECRRRGAQLKDVCATDLLSCRK
jgi:serine/threonine-protein kinase